MAELDAVDNLALGTRYANSWWISPRRERKAASALLEEFEVDLDPSKPLSAATPGEQNHACHRARGRRNRRGPSLLVLDEPTASLPQHQVDQLLRPGAAAT